MRADPEGFIVETVRRPDDGDWTLAVLAAIERPGAPPVGLASISSVHWSDGGLIDVEAVAAALKRQSAVFLIDATQSAGVLAMDVTRLGPDFVIFPTYKWLLGPYGRAFIYVAKRHQDGLPLEQTAAGRRNVGPRTMSISPTFAMWRMHGVSTWANATILFRWRWRRSAWK